MIIDIVVINERRRRHGMLKPPYSPLPLILVFSTMLRGLFDYCLLLDAERAIRPPR